MSFGTTKPSPATKRRGDQVLERPHGRYIPMRMGHLHRRVDVDLAQQVDVPWLGILSLQTASIWKRIPHCLLHVVEHHVCD